MTLLRDAWYVAAFSSEIASGPILRRTLLNDDVVLYRDTSGAPKALANRCPHRFAPLHMGKVKGDNVECPYHGLQFNGLGQCVLNPHSSAIPRAAVVRAYPVAERQGLVWIWMGDPARAVQAPVPHFGSLDEHRWTVVRGYVQIDCNYLLEVDNVLDLSHIEFVHPGIFGSEAIRRAKTRVEQKGDSVFSNRLTNAEILPPALDQAYESKGQPVDRWLNSRWVPPALIELDVGVTLTGRPHAEGRSIPTCHFFTPVSESSTHYFWTYSRDYDRENAALDAQIAEMVQYVFSQQDKPIVEAQQRVIGDADLLELRPVMLPGDAAAVRARRVVARLLAEEANASTAAAPVG